MSADQPGNAARHRAIAKKPRASRDSPPRLPAAGRLGMTLACIHLLTSTPMSRFAAPSFASLVFICRATEIMGFAGGEEARGGGLRSEVALRRGEEFVADHELSNCGGTEQRREIMSVQMPRLVGLASARSLFPAAAPFRHSSKVHGRLRTPRLSAAR